MLEKLTAELEGQTAGLFATDGQGTFAIKKDGSLWAWGNNHGGMLGVVSSENTVPVPTQVGTDTDWAR